MPWRSSNSFHDNGEQASSGLGRTQRAIANTARGRRVKAQQEKNEKRQEKNEKGKK